MPPLTLLVLELHRLAAAALKSTMTSFRSRVHGMEMGAAVGALFELLLGLSEGEALGNMLGEVEGCLLGDVVGEVEGCLLGLLLGLFEISRW